MLCGVCCLLLCCDVLRCLLSVVDYLLTVARCLLVVVGRLVLFGSHGLSLLFGCCCSLCVACCVLCIVRCSLRVVVVGC